MLSPDLCLQHTVLWARVSARACSKCTAVDPAVGESVTCCYTGDGAVHMQQACDQQLLLVYMKQEGELARA